MVLCNFTWSDFDYRGYHGIPKIVLEVQSPSTGSDDVTWKKDIYEAVGIEEYWVVYDIENVELYRLTDGFYKMTRYSLVNGENILEIPSFIFDGLVIKLDKRIMDR